MANGGRADLFVRQSAAVEQLFQSVEHGEIAANLCGLVIRDDLWDENTQADVGSRRANSFRAKGGTSEIDVKVPQSADSCIGSATRSIAMAKVMQQCNGVTTMNGVYDLRSRHSMRPLRAGPARCFKETTSMGPLSAGPGSARY